MRVAIDLLPFGKNLIGVGVYTKNLLKFFGKLHPEIEFHLFINEASKENYKYRYENYIYHYYNFHNRGQRILFEQTLFARELVKNKINILFVPSVVKPILYFNNTVITVHDMIPYVIDNKYSFLKNIYVKLMTYLSMVTAKNIISVSQSTKNDIQKYCNINGKKINVIYNGLDKEKVSNVKVIENIVVTKYNISADYLLFVGTVGPGKNILNMLKAFKLLIEKVDNKLFFVICGNTKIYGNYYEEILLYLKNNQLKNNVIFTGYISDKELASLYQYAKAFVYISFYEGFGFPVLEGMANGIPVITSNISSLPEVVGKNGCMVDPNDIEDIFQAYKKILTNDQYSKELVDNQKKELERFSWDECSKKTIDIILS